jgi:hypothetical protein
MQVEYTQLLPIGLTTDEALGISYMHCMSGTSFRSVKLPTVASKYTQSGILNILHLIDCQLIKTRKNWILKEIHTSTQILHPSNYVDYIMINNLRLVLQSHYNPESQTELLSQLLQYFSRNPIQTIKLPHFKQMVDQFLGF